MRTEQEAPLVGDVRNAEIVSNTPVSDRDAIGRRSKHNME